MHKIVLGLAAGVLGLTLAGTADARPPAHGHGHGHRVHGGHAYYHSQARRFSGGYYYVGPHHHWTRRVWDVRYHRWNYWDSDLQIYFYWYAPGNCYYPATYCP
jgi:hypothetical protein